MSHWAPKPLRPITTDGLFTHDNEHKPVTKGQNRFSAQREADGTPHTITGRLAHLPPSNDPRLVLEGLNKNIAYAEDCVTAVAGAGFAREIYDFLGHFSPDSKLKKKAVKLLEEELKLEHRQNKGSFKKNPEDYWKKQRELTLRKKELILEEQRRGLSKGLNPAVVVKTYLENGPAIAKALADREKSLSVDEDEKDADEIKKTD